MTSFKVVLLSLSLVVSSTYSFSPNPIKALTFFSPTTTSTTKDVLMIHSMSAISDAEALLAKARALREQAEADEHKLHSTLIEKKKCQDNDTDSIIQDLFPLNQEHHAGGDAAIQSLAKHIEEKRLSTSVLERVVERLHEREIAARGLEHIETTTHHQQVQFVRVAAPQEEELVRVQGLIQRLIDAAEIIDEEYLRNEREHHIVDTTHWSRGTLSKVLKEKAHFLGREHDEEFKKRTREYYEAAKKKEDTHYDSHQMY